MSAPDEPEADAPASRTAPPAAERWLGMSARLSLLVIAGLALAGIACMMILVLLLILLRAG